MTEPDDRTLREVVNDIRERFMRNDARDEETVKLVFGEKWLQKIRDTPNPQLKLTRMLEGLTKLGLTEGRWVERSTRCRRTDTPRAFECKDKITAMRMAQAYWIEEIAKAISCGCDVDPD